MYIVYNSINIFVLIFHHYVIPKRSSWMRGFENGRKDHVKKRNIRTTQNSHAVYSKETDYIYMNMKWIVYEYEFTNIIIIMVGNRAGRVVPCRIFGFMAYKTTLSSIYTTARNIPILSSYYFESFNLDVYYIRTFSRCFYYVFICPLYKYRKNIYSFAMKIRKQVNTN